MLFNSWTFVPFILTFFALYYMFPHKWQNRLILVSSYIFYGYWDVRFLFLLIFSTTVDYFVTIQLGRTEDESKRKALILTSIVVNLTLLGFFKYFNFFADSFHVLASTLGLNVSVLTLKVVLPVGISFYTFQSLSYTIDVYRRQQEPIKNFLDVATFVSYFPQLVAGPIQRAKVLAPQIMNPRKVTWQQVSEGLWLVVWGLFKKMVIADNLAFLVDQRFAPEAVYSGSEALLAVYAFALQIYCDFSGYTDTARGLAKLMGIEMKLNFNLPYLAKNPADFWHRWHISLSTWLRDYLYIPLGGSRGGKIKTYRNLMLTMLLGGLWHGAAWTFVVWGFYHGLLLAVHRWVTVDRNPDIASESPAVTLSSILSIFVMFHATCLGWLLFRANSMSQVAGFLRAIFQDMRWTGGSAEMVALLMLFGGMLWGTEAWIKNMDDPRKARGWYYGLGPAVVSLMILLIFWLAPPQTRSFIYFQF